MTLIAERVPYLNGDFLPARPEVSQTKLCKSAALQFEMQIPQKWQASFERSGQVRLAPNVGFSRNDPEVYLYHDPRFHMSAKSLVENRRSNMSETVSQPTQISVDGKIAWMIDIHNNPAALVDASKERDAIRTECVLNKDDGSALTIVFSAPSAAVHREQMPTFMRMLSSFHLTK